MVPRSLNQRSFASRREARSIEATWLAQSQSGLTSTLLDLQQSEIFTTAKWAIHLLFYLKAGAIAEDQ